MESTKLRTLTIIIGDEDDRKTTVFDGPVVNAEINMRTPWEKIRSNPQFAAMMAGASVEAMAKLPGEQVAWVHTGSEIVVTYQMRFVADNARLTEFRPTDA